MAEKNISLHKYVSIYSLKKKIKASIPQKVLNKIDFGVLCKQSQHKDTLFVYLDTEEKNNIGIDKSLHEMYNTLRSQNEKNTIGISAFGRADSNPTPNTSVNNKYESDLELLKEKIKSGYKYGNETIYFKNIFIYTKPQTESQMKESPPASLLLDFDIFHKSGYTYPIDKKKENSCKKMSDTLLTIPTTYANGEYTNTKKSFDTKYKIKILNITDKNIIIPKYFQPKVTVGDLNVYYKDLSKEDKDARKKLLELYETYVIEKKNALQKLNEDLKKIFTTLIINIKEEIIDKEDIKEDTKPLLDPKKKKYNVNDKLHISFDTSTLQSSKIDAKFEKNSIILKYDDGTTIKGTIRRKESDFFIIKNSDKTISDSSEDKEVSIVFQDNGIFNNHDDTNNKGTYELFIPNVKILGISFEDDKWVYNISANNERTLKLEINGDIKSSGNSFSVLNKPHLKGTVMLQDIYNKLPKDEELISSSAYVIGDSFKDLPADNPIPPIKMKSGKSYTPFYFDPRLIIKPKDIVKSNFFEGKEKIEKKDHALLFTNLTELQGAIRLVSEIKTMKSSTHESEIFSYIEKMQPILCDLLFFAGASYKSRTIIEYEIIPDNITEQLPKDGTTNVYMFSVHLTTTSDPDITKHVKTIGCKRKKVELKKWFRKIASTMPFLQHFVIGGKKTKRNYNKTKNNKKKISKVNRRTRRRRRRSARKRRRM